MIGFGNPLLEGPDGVDAQGAKEARDHKTCGAISEAQVAQSSTAWRGRNPNDWRIGRCLLPAQAGAASKTAGELCAVARDVHAEPREIYLGARAMEHVVKRQAIPES